MHSLSVSHTTASEFGSAFFALTLLFLAAVNQFLSGHRPRAPSARPRTRAFTYLLPVAEEFGGPVSKLRWVRECCDAFFS